MAGKARTFSARSYLELARSTKKLFVTISEKSIPWVKVICVDLFVPGLSRFAWAGKRAYFPTLGEERKYLRGRRESLYALLPPPLLTRKMLLYGYGSSAMQWNYR
jgi:hypothetical protein